MIKFRPSSDSCFQKKGRCHVCVISCKASWVIKPTRLTKTWRNVCRVHNNFCSFSNYGNKDESLLPVFVHSKIIYPSEVLVLSDVRPSKKLMFCNN